jgi:hypothetical protein
MSWDPSSCVALLGLGKLSLAGGFGEKDGGEPALMAANVDAQDYKAHLVGFLNAQQPRFVALNRGRQK